MMVYSYGTTNWVESNGGPLLLLSSDLLSSWSGARPRIISESDVDWEYDIHSDCDYNRACKIDDYLGLLQVGSGKGLVLGDEPLSTTWWPSSNLIVRWRYAESDEEVLKSLSNVASALWQPTGITFSVGKSPLCLFDSAYPGNRVQAQDPEPLLVKLSPGEYSLFTAEYGPNADTALLLHRLVRE
jgi:hypothetical protein